jgi:hypothetical protein
MKFLCSILLLLVTLFFISTWNANSLSSNHKFSYTAIRDFTDIHGDTSTKRFLDSLASFLNETIPSFQDTLRGLQGFSVDSQNRPYCFFVCDLNNPKNSTQNSHINFKYYPNHLYHFGSGIGDISFSNIVFYENGKLKYFQALNCADKGDKVKDAIKYLLQKGIVSKKNRKLISRVENYRKYGKYFYTDYQSLRLSCEIYMPKR